MNASARSSWWPIATAFTIWFAHFMACWAAGEIWPHQWTANALAWVVTAIALTAVRWHHLRVRARHEQGELPGWDYRFAQGAVAIATVALLFTALPSLVFLP